MFDDDILGDGTEMAMVDQAIEDNEEAEEDILFGLADVDAIDQLIPDNIVDKENDSTDYEKYINEEEKHDE